MIPDSLEGQAELLKQIARETRIEDYRKSVRSKKQKTETGPSKKRRKKKPNVAHKHVATGKLLGLSKE